MAPSPPLRPRDRSIIGAAVFLALVSLLFIALVVQFLLFKLTQPDQRMDVAEWPLLGVAVLAAVLPISSAILLMTGRGGRGLGLVSAVLIGLIGALALVVGLSFLSIGVAWDLLIGGFVMLVGAIWTLMVLRRPVAP